MQLEISFPFLWENAIFDCIILLKSRYYALAGESSLHLERKDAFHDLFEVTLPRARPENLVRELGMCCWIVFMGRAAGRAKGAMMHQVERKWVADRWPPTFPSFLDPCFNTISIRHHRRLNPTNDLDTTAGRANFEHFIPASACRSSGY